MPADPKRPVRRSLLGRLSRPLRGIAAGVALATCSLAAGEARAEDDLTAAAKAGDAHRIAELIASGADIEARSASPFGGQGWTPLLHAVHADQPEAVRLLLEAGAETTVGRYAELVYRARQQMHATLIAAEHAGPEVMRVLLEADADHLVELNDSDSLLHIAATNKHPELIDLLVQDANLAVDAFNEVGQTPLYLASEWYHERSTPELEDHIVRDPDLESGRLLVMLALLDNGAEVRRLDGNLMTPLETAVTFGTYDQVRLLVEWGALPFESIPDEFIIYKRSDLRDRTPRTPTLLQAAQSADRGVIPLLVDIGADLAATTASGGDLLNVATGAGNALVIEDLLGLGFDVEGVYSESKMTNLMRACLVPNDHSRRRDRVRGDLPVARLLLEAGAEVNRADAQGRTALHYAAGAGLPALVELLLEAGADPTIADAEGRLPADYCTPGAPELGYYTINQASRARAMPLFAALDAADEPEGSAESESEPQSETEPDSEPERD